MTAREWMKVFKKIPGDMNIRFSIAFDNLSEKHAHLRVYAGEYYCLNDDLDGGMFVVLTDGTKNF